jgi:hypothetical protein
VFNGDLAGLQSWGTASNCLNLELCLTDYKTFHFAKENPATRRNQIIRYNLACAIGVSVVLKSADDRLLLIERSQTVGESPGLLDVIGGHIDPSLHERNGIPDPFIAISAEIAEETGLEADKQGPATCFGLIEAAPLQKPELLFQMHVQQAAKEIISIATERACSEISQIFAIAANPETVQGFLETEHAQLSPSAYGVLSIYGRLL